MHIKRGDDFDEYAQYARDLQACEVLVHHPKSHEWTMGLTELGDLRFQLGWKGSGTITEGQSPRDGVNLFLAHHIADSVTANGCPVEGSGVIILEPGCDFCFNSPAAQFWSSVFIPTETLERAGLRLAGRSACRVADDRARGTSHLHSLMLRIRRALETHPHIAASPASVAASSELLTAAANVLGLEPDDVAPAPGEELIRRAKAFMESQDDDPVAIAELAAGVGTSERTLRRAFSTCTGVSPKRYLQLRQLHSACRALRAADADETTVSKVLVKFGVWEFGRFAQRYRKQFGELPSETLRRTRSATK